MDTVLLRYSVRVNGMTELAFTKLDVLTGLDPIRVCIAYRDQAGEHRSLPFGSSNLADFEPVYEELPGWERDLTSAATWDELPPQAQAYIRRVEDLSEVPVRQVSVGPERDQLIRLG